MKRIILLTIVWLGICFNGTGQISKTINTNQNDLKTEKINEYDKIYLDNVYNAIDIVGHPELPVKFQSFVVPLDAKIAGVQVYNQHKEKVDGKYNVYPAQPPRTVSDMDIPEFVLPDPKIYNSSTPYPGKQAEIVSDDVYLGYRIVTVELYPVEYIPDKGELYICDFSFSIDYSVNHSETGKFEMQTQSLYRYEMNKKNVKFYVDNPEFVEGARQNSPKEEKII
jgi:hypothetical protein